MPFVLGMLNDKTMEAAIDWKYKGNQVEIVEVKGDDGYPRLLKELWGKREDVLIMEQDILPHASALLDLSICDQPWCAYSYPPFLGQDLSMPNVIVTMGCCKISALMQAATWECWATWDFPDWRACDQRLTSYARRAGLKPHQHRPDVGHRL